MIDLSDINALESYFKNIADSNVNISSFVFGDDNQIDIHLKDTRIDSQLLWVEPFQPVMIDSNNADNYLGTTTVTGVILLPASEMDIASQYDAYDQAQFTVLQIISKITNDYQLNEILYPVDRAKYGQITLLSGGVSYVGCRFDLTMIIKANINFDPTKFNFTPVLNYAVGLDSSSILVAFSVLERGTEFEIQYGTIDFSSTLTVPGSANAVTIPGLNPGTTYQIRLVNKKGSYTSDPSNVIQATTYADTQAPVNWIKGTSLVTDLTNASNSVDFITITAGVTAFLGEKYLGYKVRFQKISGSQKFVLCDPNTGVALHGLEGTSETGDSSEIYLYKNGVKTLIRAAVQSALQLNFINSVKDFYTQFTVIKKSDGDFYLYASNIYQSEVGEVLIDQWTPFDSHPAYGITTNVTSGRIFYIDYTSEI